MVLGKLYSNSLLVVFNSRLRITGGRGFSTPLPTSDEDGDTDDGVRRATHLETLVFARRTVGELESVVVGERAGGAGEKGVPSDSEVRVCARWWLPGTY